MGAASFTSLSLGCTATDAFSSARRDAAYRHGHDGYTGTIAEKSTFIIIRDSLGEVTKRFEASGIHAQWIKQRLAGTDTLNVALGIAEALMYLDDPRIDDKYGPAGCIDLGIIAHDSLIHNYLFFGYAAE